MWSNVLYVHLPRVCSLYSPNMHPLQRRRRRLLLTETCVDTKDVFPPNATHAAQDRCVGLLLFDATDEATQERYAADKSVAAAKTQRRFQNGVYSCLGLLRQVRVACVVCSSEQHAAAAAGVPAVLPPASCVLPYDVLYVPGTSLTTR